MIKVLSIFGTRPEAIKMAPVVKELEKHSLDGVKSMVCVTGQHRQMLDAVLSWFDIRPDVDLDLMEKNQSLYSLTSKAIGALAHAINHPGRSSACTASKSIETVTDGSTACGG